MITKFKIFEYSLDEYSLEPDVKKRKFYWLIPLDNRRNKAVKKIDQYIKSLNIPNTDSLNNYLDFIANNIKQEIYLYVSFEDNDRLISSRRRGFGWNRYHNGQGHKAFDESDYIYMGAVCVDPSETEANKFNI